MAVFCCRALPTLVEPAEVSQREKATMPFDATKLKNIGKNTLDAVIEGFKAHAQVASAEAKIVLLEGAKMSAACAVDFANGNLTFDQLKDFVRKIGVMVETEMAKLALEASRAYIRTVLDTLLGGALKILGAF